eukprot:355355-Chlamydomonas_euryale.AAC.7
MRGHTWQAWEIVDVRCMHGHVCMRGSAWEGGGVCCMRKHTCAHTTCIGVYVCAWHERPEWVLACIACMGLRADVPVCAHAATGHKDAWADACGHAW